MKRIIIGLIIGGSILLGAIVIHFYWLDGLSGAACEIILGRTEFSPKYREYKYRQVMVSMTSNDVVALLGKPIWTIQTRLQGEEVWNYTKPKVWDKNGQGANCFWTRRALFVSNGVVTIKRHYFTCD